MIPWHRQMKETKRGGMGGRKSQCLDSTVEAGEQSPERTPGREARHRDYGLVVGTYHAHLRKFLQLRVRDGVLKRLIGKWLKAGVMESGSISYPDAGSPQGGVISPLLANVFLHYVLDTWFRQEVQPRLRGCAHLSVCG